MRIKLLKQSIVTLLLLLGNSMAFSQALYFQYEARDSLISIYDENNQKVFDQAWSAKGERRAGQHLYRKTN